MDSVIVYGNATVFGGVEVYGNAIVYGGIILCKDVAVSSVEDFMIISPLGRQQIQKQYPEI